MLYCYSDKSVQGLSEVVLELGVGAEFSILEVLEHIEQANRGYQGLKQASGTYEPYDRVSTFGCDSICSSFNFDLLEIFQQRCQDPSECGKTDSLH